jgi:hypothetical protein
MSHFLCEICNAAILDSPNGYVTGCPHYPIERRTYMSVKKKATKKKAAKKKAPRKKKVEVPETASL